MRKGYALCSLGRADRDHCLAARKKRGCATNCALRLSIGVQDVCRRSRLANDGTGQRRLPGFMLAMPVALFSRVNCAEMARPFAELDLRRASMAQSFAAVLNSDVAPEHLCCSTNGRRRPSATTDNLDRLRTQRALKIADASAPGWPAGALRRRRTIEILSGAIDSIRNRTRQILLVALRKIHMRGRIP